MKENNKPVPKKTREQYKKPPCIKNGNPVPSIDNNLHSLEKIRRKYMKNHRPIEKQGFGSACINSFVKFAINELQNGVETDKEQPKKFKCRKGYDGCDHYEGDDICHCQ